MALFLSRSIRRLMADESMTNGAAGRIDVEVVAVPCVASSSAHTDMLTRLDAETGVTGHVPRVLSQGDEEGVEMQKYRFGRPSKALFDTWEMVQRETGVDFDLLYAPRAWQLLMRHDLWTNDDFNVMYYHCGGLEGNDSMMKRYMRIKNRSSS